MVGGKQEIPVRLFRDSINTPFGFRLQGGSEVNAPLTIQRVFAGGVADGQLQRGDQLVAIDNRDVTNVSHHTAEDIIRKSGRELLLTVIRNSQSHYFTEQQAQGVDYPHRNASTNEDYERLKSMNEIKNLFSHTDDNDIVRGRVQINPKPGSTSYVPKRPIHLASKKYAPSPKEIGLAYSTNPQVCDNTINDMGWVPHSKASPFSKYHDQQSRARSPPINRVGDSVYTCGGRDYSSRIDSVQVASYNRPTRGEKLVSEEYNSFEKPAWLGTLKSLGGVKPWELHDGIGIIGGYREKEAPVLSSNAYALPRTSEDDVKKAAALVHQPHVHTARYSPGGTPHYDQHHLEPASHDRSSSHKPSSHNSFQHQPTNEETARVAHLQYNTPLGLYSRKNAAQVLEAQTEGKPGYGTMHITGDGKGGRQATMFEPVKNTDVFRMVREEEELKRLSQQQQRQHYKSSSESAPPLRQLQQSRQTPSGSDHQHRTQRDRMEHGFGGNLGISDF